MSGRVLDLLGEKEKRVIDKMLKADTTLVGGLLETIYRRGLADRSLDKDTLVYTSVEDGLLQGVAFVNQLDYCEHELTYLWVAPRVRGCGVGSRLLGDVLASLDEGVLTVSTWSTNYPQMRLLSGHGFNLMDKKRFPLAGFELLFYSKNVGVLEGAT